MANDFGREAGGTAGSHVLMTLDAVGGVWRYAMDLAAGLKREGFAVTFAGMGPKPSADQGAEAARLGDLVWLDTPLDWLVEDERALDAIPPAIAALVAEREIDLVHLNLPSQAAGLVLPVPVIVVSHSCVVTWFAAVRGTEVPAPWAWQARRKRAGFDACDLAIAPSHAHAAMVEECYGPVSPLRVIHNAVRPIPSATQKRCFVLAVGRWWDEGKNAEVMDAAAGLTEVPVIVAGDNLGPAGQQVLFAHADHRGSLPHNEIRSLMAEAAIVCSPSRYEPFGLAALEAAAGRAALVLADIPTYRELWDGAALFAPADDPEGFAQAINRLAEDDDMRSALTREAYRRAQDLTPALQARTTAAAYRTALAKLPRHQRS